MFIFDINLKDQILKIILSNLRNINLMIKIFFLFAILVFCNDVIAQQSECKVIPANISGTYTGGCKNGLANGKGIARGIDTYEGRFKNGIPDGNGTYTWATGKYFEGHWKNGMKEGAGKMVYRDSTVSGFWKDDKYLGKTTTSPFIIKFSLSVPRYTITKSDAVDNVVRIKIMMNGDDNFIEDFSMGYSSGEEYRINNIYSIRNPSFPLDVKVTYTSWNQIHTGTHAVIFEFTINDQGAWDVTLFN
jgi:hypothetical protein